MSKFADYSPEAERGSWLSLSDGLVIRSASAADVAEVAEIAAEREGQPVENWLPWFERKLVEAHEGRALVLVASHAGRALGYGTVGIFTHPPNSPPHVAPEGWYLTGVVIRPEFRRRGLGSQLTAARLGWIRERGASAYYFTNERNRASVDLHRAAGFVELTREFFFPGVRFEGGVGILFVCKLGQDPPD